MKVIRAVAFANGAPCPHAGEWLRRFDHDAYNGVGYGVFTTDKASAALFANACEALEFWRRQSSVRPFRGDGEPNRPMTALTIEVEDADDGADAPIV